MITGTKPFDRMVEGLPPHSFIQLVGDDTVPLYAIALHFMKSLKAPVYFNSRGIVSKELVAKMFGDNIVMVEEPDGAKAGEMMRYAMSSGADGVIVDDLPSIVSTEERNGSGDEFDTLIFLSRLVVRLKSLAIENKIRIVWLNQLRHGNKTIRIWGDKFFNRKMNITFFCEHRGVADIGEPDKNGEEYTIRTVVSDHHYIHRKTFFGLFDGMIDECYWILKEALRYKVIIKRGGRYYYNNKEFSLKGIFSSLHRTAIFNSVLGRIEDAEKTQKKY